MDIRNPMNLWWLTMVMINGAGFLVYLRLWRSSAAGDSREPENRRYKKILRICGGIFVFVSLYRSIFVCSYPSRLAWFPTMFNSPLIIRMLATFAELSFALLVALPVIHVNRELPPQTEFSRGKLGRVLIFRLPWLTVICLFTAQFFAYTGLFTQHLILFAIEESLWALGFLAIAPAVLTQCFCVWKYHGKDPAYGLIRLSMLLLGIFTAGYLLYQLGYALPFNYYARIGEDLQRTHPGILEGLGRALFDFTATRDFDTWGGIGFFIWHSGYFSICTWLNMVYAMAPRKLLPENREKV